ncbi:hypothetical protein SASPL_121355 [Salvia splendens]|uniref:Uncharacterized protein n=1 Tax=Salvia splendens TaxID=180675 RepID=A0A8X8ZW44_SALSN|nr:hypothetical protein SASPL_121355 [Salvia splendens]
MHFSPDDENEMPDMPSSIPFLPHLLELKLGIGGTSYEDFISKMHLPMQLSEVDPIVASFSGGAVGVISEFDAARDKQWYLSCACCSASGLCVSIEPIVTSATDRSLNAPATRRCQNCSGSGKVFNYVILSYASPLWLKKIYIISLSTASSNSLVFNDLAFDAIEMTFYAISNVTTMQTNLRKKPDGFNVMEVMCPTCLCTGMIMASEHDPRIEPFD